MKGGLNERGEYGCGVGKGGENGEDGRSCGRVLKDYVGRG